MGDQRTIGLAFTWESAEVISQHASHTRRFTFKQFRHISSMTTTSHPIHAHLSASVPPVSSYSPHLYFLTSCSCLHRFRHLSSILDHIRPLPYAHTLSSPELAPMSVPAVASYSLAQTSAKPPEKQVWLMDWHLQALQLNDENRLQATPTSSPILLCL